MLLRQSALPAILFLFLIVSCGESPKKDKDKVGENIAKSDTVTKTQIDTTSIEEEEEEENPFS